MTRTDTYQFTVKMIDGKVDPADQASVEKLRAEVKRRNTYCEQKQYVKLQGRGPRPTRRYHQSLPLHMATSADVYVYTRNEY